MRRQARVAQEQPGRAGCFEQPPARPRPARGRGSPGPDRLRAGQPPPPRGLDQAAVHEGVQTWARSTAPTWAEPSAASTRSASGSSHRGNEWAAAAATWSGLATIRLVPARGILVRLGDRIAPSPPTGVPLGLPGGIGTAVGRPPSAGTTPRSLACGRCRRARGGGTLRSSPCGAIGTVTPFSRPRKRWNAAGTVMCQALDDPALGRLHAPLPRHGVLAHDAIIGGDAPSGARRVTERTRRPGSISSCPGPRRSRGRSAIHGKPTAHGGGVRRSVPNPEPGLAVARPATTRPPASHGAWGLWGDRQWPRETRWGPGRPGGRRGAREARAGRDRRPRAPAAARSAGQPWQRGDGARTVGRTLRPRREAFTGAFFSRRVALWVTATGGRDADHPLHVGRRGLPGAPRMTA